MATLKFIGIGTCVRTDFNTIYRTAHTRAPHMYRILAFVERAQNVPQTNSWQLRQFQRDNAPCYEARCIIALKLFDT